MKMTIRISTYIGALIAAYAMLSCTNNENFLDSTDGEGIVLTFTTGSGSVAQVKSSTQEDGDDDYNENKLNSLYYFLYPKGVTDKAPSVSGFKSGISSTGTYSVKIPVSANTIVNDLFASDNECQLFAVANPPADIVSTLEGKPTLEDLRVLEVLSSLKSVPQSNFVMVYDGTVEAASLSDKISINSIVELKRLASKFTIGALVAPSITKGTATYTPNVLNVYLCNGINRTTLGGWNADVVEDGDYFSTDYAELSFSTEYYYTYQEVVKEEDIAALGTPEVLTVMPTTVDSKSKPAIKVGDKYYKLEHYLKASSTKPIYSYPMEWEFNSETEPYLMYELNWKVKDGEDTSYKSLFYKLTLGRRSITQNEWYDISAKLTVLGSLYPEEPTEIYYYMDYLVKDWKGALSDGGVSTPAQIKDTRYLAVTQTEWVLNNKDEVTIPFSSSHTCNYTGLTATKKNFSGGKPTNETVTGVTLDFSVPNQVIVKHTLNNTLGPGMDMSPIEISFTLKHTDNADFNQIIHITQYPAISVSTECNSSGPSETNTYKGYTYVNGIQNGATWMTVLGANGSGENSSHYFALITVSQFDPSTGYVVGDPRDTEINNLGSDRKDPWTGTGNYAPFPASAKYTNDGQAGNRTLKYYYPTIDDGSRDNFVAPAFRVSTAHTRSGRNDTYADIKKRCASYQEDGYPAGRWRIPTLAECQVCQILSSNEMVPNIFIKSSTARYYYAGGWFLGNATSAASDWHSGTTTTTGAATRCVYDEWYWSQIDAEFGWNNGVTYDELQSRTDKNMTTEERKVKQTFIWGDMPRDYIHK